MNNYYFKMVYMKLKNILLVFVMLNNSYAGTIINGSISAGKGGDSIFGDAGDGGNIYGVEENKDGYTVSVGKGGKSIFGKNGKDGKVVNVKNKKNSTFKKKDKGKDIIIQSKSERYVTKDQTLKSVDGGKSTFENAGDGGDIYIYNE